MATAKKTTKKTVKKTTSLKGQVQEAKAEVKSTVRKKPSKKTIIFFLAVIIIAVLVYVFRGLFVAATVNGELIPRWTLSSSIEGQYGEEVLQDLIVKKLILQDMAKNSISVSEEELSAEIKKTEDALKEQGRTLEEALPTIGLKTHEQFKERTMIEMLLKKKFSKDTAVTDEEVEKYLTDNAEVLPVDENAEALKSSIKEQLTQQKLQEKVQTWIQELQAKATINRFVSF